MIFYMGYPMLKLVGLWDSPFVRRVAVTMRLYGIRFEPAFYSVYRHAEQMRAINPLLTAPSLMLPDGEVLIDSAAIIDYLDELHGRKNALTPPDGIARRQVLNVVAQASVACEKVGQLYRELDWRPADLRYSTAIDRFRSQIAESMRLLDQRLDGEWYVGTQMTQADIAAAIMYRFVQYYTAALNCLPPQPLAKLAGLSQRCELLDAFRLTPLE
jgi:glutathione S-transferase